MATDALARDCVTEGYKSDRDDTSLTDCKGEPSNATDSLLSVLSSSKSTANAQSPKKTPKGHDWVTSLSDQVPWQKYESSRKFQAAMRKCPLPGDGVMKTAYRLLATMDVQLVACLFGISGIALDRLPCDLRMRSRATPCSYFILMRGNSTGLKECDAFRTNKNYLPRQFELLEFVSANEHLCTPFSEIAKLARGDEGKLRRQSCVFKDSLPLVTAEAVVAFFKDKVGPEGCEAFLVEGEAAVVETIDVRNLVTVQLEGVEDGNPLQRRRKKKRQRFVGLGHSDIRLYEAAFEELCNAQRHFLDLAAVWEDLGKQPLYKEYITRLKSRARETTRFDKMDKGTNGISRYPSKNQISAMLQFWRDQGSTPCCPNRAYNGLMYSTMWLNATQSGLQRFDNIHRVLYSDKEVVQATDYAEEENAPEGVNVFLTKSHMSKTNRNGALTYTSAIPHQKVHMCPILHEAVFVVLKHDLLNTKTLQFALVSKIKLAGRPLCVRSWYLDFIFNPSKRRGSPQSFYFQNVKLPEIDTSLKSCISYESAYDAFEQSYAKIGLHSSAVLHLPRKIQTIQNGFNEIPLSETCRQGHWNESNDVFAQSYAQLPAFSSMAKMAGCHDGHYLPHWTVLQPPKELLDSVLPQFAQALQYAEKMREAALAVEDPEVQFLLYDPQSLQTLKYIEALRIKFIQGSVWLDSLFPQGHPIHHHPLFRDPLFQNYKETSLFLAKVLEELPPMVKNLISGTFYYGRPIGEHSPSFSIVDASSDTASASQGCDVLLRHSAKGKNSGVMDVMCNILHEAKTQDTLETAKTYSTVNKVVRAMAYGDLKADVMLLTSAVTDLVRAFGGKRAFLDTDEADSDSSVEHPAKLSRRQSSETDVPIIPILPTVGSLSVSDIMSLWMQGKSGVHPPLKELMSSEQPNRVLYGSRKEGKNTQNQARGIRIVATCMELLDGRVTCPQVDEALQRIDKNTSKFSKELAVMFKELRLTSRNTLTVKDSIQSHPNFDIDALQRKFETLLR